MGMYLRSREIKTELPSDGCTKLRRAFTWAEGTQLLEVINLLQSVHQCRDGDAGITGRRDRTEIF